MKKAELILGISCLVALALNLSFLPGGSILTVLTFSALSVFYLYFGFALFNDVPLKQIFQQSSYTHINKGRIIGAVGVGIALSATTGGLMFKFQSWPGAKINLGIGVFALFLVTIVGLFKYSKNRSPYYTNIFKRVVLFGALALTLLFIPKKTWLNFKYRNNPAYVEALEKAMADPGNAEL